MANVGYVMVSTKHQNIDRQIVALPAFGINKFFIDKMSGKDTARPELKLMLQYIHEDDTIYTETISRLARSTKDFLELVEIITATGANIVSPKENIDTSTPQSKFMLTVFGALYELEREIIKQRQM